MSNGIKKLAIQNTISNEEIKSLIYTIRGKQVMLDSDVAMLAGILKNEIAVAVSINIIKSFIEMRKFLNSNGQVFERLTNYELIS